MPRNLRAELTALRRANERLLRELHPHDRDDTVTFVEPMRRSAGESAPRGGSDVDQIMNNATSERTPLRHSRNQSRLERVISPSPDNGSASIASRRGMDWQPGAKKPFERIDLLISDDPRRQQEALGERLEKLENEVKCLRSELATARQRPIDSGSEDEMRGRLILQSSEPLEREVVVSHTIDRVPGRMGRPWHYLPLLLSIVLITIALITLVVLVH